MYRQDIFYVEYRFGIFKGVIFLGYVFRECPGPGTRSIVSIIVKSRLGSKEETNTSFLERK